MYGTARIWSEGVRFTSSLAWIFLSSNLAIAQVCGSQPDGGFIGPSKSVAFTPVTLGKGVLRNPLQVEPALSDMTMLAFGDSVVWGDGLTNSNKSVIKVAQTFADLIGRRVLLVSYAHSGARLLAADNDWTPSKSGLVLGDLDGEEPTTAQQAACAATQHADAELVLLDGCINEVKATDIALPMLLADVSVPEIRSRTIKACSKMREVLLNVTADFPNATIVVQNYYRIVSKRSSPFNAELKPHPTKNSETMSKDEETALHRLISKQVKMELKAEKERPEGSGRDMSRLPDVTIPGWGDKSEMFLRCSQSQFEQAVLQANGSLGASEESDACELAQNLRLVPNRVTRSQRTFLAVVPDNADYSYGAPEKHLWSFPFHLLFWTFRADEMYKQRRALCKSYLSATRRWSCEVNATAHPNHSGSDAFTDSIVEILEVAWGS